MLEHLLDLLFSFEFCSKAFGIYFQNRSRMQSTCYFLLNFVLEAEGKEAEVEEETACYFLLNFVDWDPLTGKVMKNLLLLFSFEFCRF